jgi:hypothetical protein
MFYLKPVSSIQDGLLYQKVHPGRKNLRPSIAFYINAFEFSSHAIEFQHMKSHLSLHGNGVVTCAGNIKMIESIIPKLELSKEEEDAVGYGL